MTWKECKILIKSDLARLNKIKFGCISYLITNASFKITFWFRIGSYLKQKRSLFFRILYMIVFLIHKHNQYLTGIQLPIGTSIGKGLRFEHFSCIIINPSAIIGANCTIMQGVTIGSERGPKGGVPNIGDNVVISCGSLLIGDKITFWFRIGSYLKQKRSLFFRILYMIVFLIHKHNQYLTGIQLPIGTSIGKGLRFEHFSCIIINPSAIIGANCTIMQGVTIGSERGPKGGVPNIGDNVVISCGSLLIGDINIGNNVMIGAGAVVVTNIPNNTVAVGVPAKVVSFDGREKVLLHID